MTRIDKAAKTRIDKAAAKLAKLLNKFDEDGVNVAFEYVNGDTRLVLVDGNYFQEASANTFVAFPVAERDMIRRIHMDEWTLTWEIMTAKEES